MFWKNKDTQYKPKKSPGHRGVPSLITSDTHILGNIVSDSVLDFNGTIDGNIRCQQLTVRKDAIVKGEITADSVYIYGKVEGLIRASHAHLYGTCHIEGIVMHESITIEDGAFIDGKCKRTNKIEEKAAPDDNDEDESPVELPKIMENIHLIR